MSYCRNQPQRFAVAFVTIVCAMVWSVDAWSGHPLDRRPPTPGPCGADGVCRPNQLTFGYNKTRWRPWPGSEQPSLQPTQADDIQLDSETRLDSMERPAPEKEDMRGPAKTRSADEADQLDTGDTMRPLPEVNEQPPANPLPDLGPLPGEPPLPDLGPLDERGPPPDANPLPENDFFDQPNLEGRFRAPARPNDAPPALPQSLQAARPSAKHVAQRRRIVAMPSTLPVVEAKQPAISQPRLLQEVGHQPLPLVVPAVAQQPSAGIKLVNPASTGVMPSVRHSLYEQPTGKGETVEGL